MRRRRMMKNHGFTAEEKVIVTNYIKNAFQKIDLYRISDDFWSLIISILPQEILLHIQKILEKYNETDRENRRISKKSFKHLPVYKKISKECIYLEDYEQEEIFDIIEKYIYTVKSKNLVLKKVKKLEKIFDLNLEELEIISFIYLKNVNEWDFCGYEFDRDQSIENFLNIPNSNIKKLLSHKNTLMYNEIINIDNDFALSETMMEYLSTDSSSLLNYLCTKEYGDYDIESFFLDEHIRNNAVTMMKKIPDVKILLYGASGTGKTSFAKSLAEYAGKAPYTLDENENLWIASRCISYDEVLIIDEADDLLNEGMFSFMKESKKAKLNKDLDDIDKPCIFITNTLKYADKSVLRRFHYIIKFSDLSDKENAVLWQKNIIDIEKILTEQEIKEHAKKYSLPIGIVSKAVDSAVTCYKSKEKRKKMFESILESHNSLRNKNSITKFEPKSNFNMEFLNTDISVDTIKSYIEHYKNMQEKERCAILFHGEPGTGKTEFARFLAKLTGFDHKTLSVSDFLSPYVGETEANIAKAFKEAIKKNMVLIFDEADSLLSDRRGAARSWEVSQVNEFLAQLDRYKGVFIATTNFVKQFDMAAMRRFNWKVEFKSIAQNKIKNAFEYFFPQVDFGGLDDKFKNIKKITAGDIAVIISKVKFMENIKGSEIVDLALIEQKYKEQYFPKSVGF